MFLTKNNIIKANIIDTIRLVSVNCTSVGSGLEPVNNEVILNFTTKI